MRKILTVAAPNGTVLATVAVPAQVWARARSDFDHLAAEAKATFNQVVTVHDEVRCSTFASVARVVRRLNGGR